MKQFISDNEVWAQAQWGKSQLGDLRRNTRAVKIAARLLNSPAASLPTQMVEWKGLKAAYRLLNSEHTTHSRLQKEHWNNVVSAASKSRKTVLFIQDKSELDYSSKKETKGLGPIGNHFGRGIIIQSILAVEYHKKPLKVLGLAHQAAWVRGEMSYQKTEKLSDRYKRSTEADCWTSSLQNIEKPDDLKTQWVSVGDRENDIYKFISFCKKSSWHFVVRGKKNRIIVTPSGEKLKLADWARSLSPQASKQLELRARPKSPSRKVSLSIAWGTIFIKTPKNGFRVSDHEMIKVSCLRVWEEGPGGLEWFLVTDLEIRNKEDALEKVGWYEARWLIEEYHKCLKTGCALEKSQLKTSNELLALLGFLGVIATMLLSIKYLAKQKPSDKAIDHYPRLNLQILSSKFNLSIEDMTCHEYWRNIARLGGFMGRKSDRDPGWQTLWRGYLKFCIMRPKFQTTS